MHFFAHGSYQKSIGKDNHCGLLQAGVSRCLKEVVRIINEHIAHRYVTFSNNSQAMTAVKTRFFEKLNFPGIVGCIDCTHIAIVPPPANNVKYPAHVFMNRKGHYSINCQII
ncbi:hypothetical protein ILUMI_01686 [Ignelater luminosus]|uniref:Nuclease HARBI1 n=1 Tax=Ignelater luminosus TaxID=2038154 RepID=A0A8K0GNY5_IGNLU|nr:hypothetical protein ILUMI_01686 [Ignelater luminosus]